MIVPTIGRKVWFYTAPGTPEQDATVIDVHGDSCVSLFVISRQGTTTVERSVILVQEGDETPTGSHCTWMPYQIGQAAKAAAASFPNEPVLSPSPEGALVEGAGVVSAAHFNSVAGAEQQPT